ncbi:MAG: flagellar assembly protein FliW [Sulfurospirillaceae bacterium]|jgi:flagellar assembly factor FliW|nr:flagellar assembly protein FliW [Sulfurospirillaceae bacterium]MCK9546679.1 flagellar assembly protein FliW [Sulfurospirillaceae bacterium]MDY0237777.1 flagellar assembly protein FliW [Campylobacterales bacterium]NLM98435.1 flagellar assembly protein FliW [Campylobacteraceae bacterium]
MIFNVASAIPGFSHVKTVELKKIDDFFMQLKSGEDETSFTLINPYLLREYPFEIPSFYKEILQIDKESAILILNIMIVAKPIEHSTINFIAPVIFNTDSKTMAQVLLDQEKYPDYGIMEGIKDYLKGNDEA